MKALNATQNTLSLKSIFTDFKEITKAGLAVSVVFSSLAGYLLGVFDFNASSWTTLIMLAIGGYCMVGASNAFNQIIEKDLDKLMDRTKNRPIPAERMSTTTAFIIACLLTVIGLTILYNINPKTAMFGAVSIFLYTSAYTPLKTVTSLSVFVGAIPGAIPFMLGWVAATDDFGIEAGTLFLIQFFWQFPHFWSIGWFLYEDYEKAGFFMLPTGKKDDKTDLLKYGVPYSITAPEDVKISKIGQGDLTDVSVKNNKGYDLQIFMGSAQSSDINKIKENKRIIFTSNPFFSNSYFRHSS